MKRRILMFLTMLTFACVNSWAQGPNGSGTYYQKASGKSGSNLKTAMAGIINSHTKIGYDGLYEAYKKTDTRADGYVRDWYSITTKYRHVTDKAGSYSKEGDCYNREHSVPQSWFDGSSSKSYITCDVVHVIPTDGYVNNRRSNYPLAEVSEATYTSNGGYCKLGSCKTDGYSGTVFEPNDAIKGDMARMYFYMVTCYQSEAPGWGHNVFSSSYNGFSKWALDMLMRWSKEDPIDAVEIARNNAVYEVQNNRNPFVDYPGLEDYIWGDKQNKGFSYDNYEGGGGTVVPIVAMPVISPDEGAYYNSVEVTISCATEGASIYYTTDGADASEQSILYEGPFTLTENATIKAVAIKGTTHSVQAISDYIINKSTPDVPVSGEFVLNNALFNSTLSETINKSDYADDFTGTTNGITLVYSLDSGQQRYMTASEIRLYTGNELKVSVGQGSITSIEFTIGKKTGSMNASTGTMANYTWTGNSSNITFTANATVSLLKMKVTVDTGATDIYQLEVSPQPGQRVIYNLQGQRVLNPTRGLYIVDGKKIYINR